MIKSGTSTWHLGQGGRWRKGSGIGGSPPQAAAAFDLKSGLSVSAYESYINMMSLQKQIMLLNFPHPTLHLHMCSLPEFCHGIVLELFV